VGKRRGCALEVERGGGEAAAAAAEAEVEAESTPVSVWSARRSQAALLGTGAGMGKAAAALLGGDAVRFFFGLVDLNPPGGLATSWVGASHSDSHSSVDSVLLESVRSEKVMEAGRGFENGS
jgi:hypothetical protein